MTTPADDPAATASPKRPVAKLLPSDEYSQYLLTSQAEMFAICRGLSDHVSQISMIFNEGQDMVLTSLVSWGSDGLVFDLGATAEMNRKALQAEKLFCTAQLDRVEIQFILRGVDQIEFNGQAAFHASLPDSILRLQRRECFRLGTPIANPVICRLRVPGAGGESSVLQVHVVDISLGGVSLAGLPVDLPLESDMTFQNCSIDLPDGGPIAATLRPCWQIETVSRSGIRAKRAGFAFVDLPRVKTTVIQRYIIKIERERKARELG